MPLPPAATRRRRHRAAVLGTALAGPSPDGPPARPRAIAGTIIDASPHLLVLSTHVPGQDPGTCRGIEVRLPMTSGTAIWHGGGAGLYALVPGREVIVRLAPGGHAVERVWVDIVRVTGTIVSYGHETAELDMGPHRGKMRVVIPPHALGRVLVRHPRMEPGNLMDVICIRSPNGPLAIQPGTAQPSQLTARPASGGKPASGWKDEALSFLARLRTPGASRGADGDSGADRTGGIVRGTATWFGGLGCPADVNAQGTGASGRWDMPDGRGAAYPAVDPEGFAGGCADAPESCTPLPYLSLGSEMAVRNECAGVTGRVPVVECGCLAARFCDRCVECDASPRGRVVELSPAAFVDLGGDLAAGCFNVSLGMDAGMEEK